jgi:hypothetical protein
MWTPLDLADGILMSEELRLAIPSNRSQVVVKITSASLYHATVPHANDFVRPCSCYSILPVLIPVDGQQFCGCARRDGKSGCGQRSCE